MIKVFIDGASAGNPGPSGAGIFIKKENGEVERIAIPLGEMSNHEAEFHALVHALNRCVESGYTQIFLHTDSQLVEQAVEKRYVKQEAYAVLLNLALARIDQLALFFIKWIPSKKNTEADQLARQAIQLH